MVTTVVGRSSVSLWSSKVILGCAILLSSPAGVFLAWLNYRTMGERSGRFADKARTYLIATIAYTIVYILVANFLTNAGLSAVTYLINIGVGFLIKSDMDGQISDLEVMEGGANVETASAWTAIGVALLFSLILVAAFLGLGAAGL